MDYREQLKSVFEKRVGKNPAYSLRAFARDLGISPGHLCEVLSGKHRLSRRLATIVMERLGPTSPIPGPINEPTNALEQ